MAIRTEHVFAARLHARHAAQQPGTDHERLHGPALLDVAGAVESLSAFGLPASETADQPLSMPC